MKKFTDIINEQESRKDFKYIANVKVEGTVTAASEGEAGELVDKEMDTIPGMIDYQIENIDEVTNETKVNENSGVYGNNVRFINNKDGQYLNAKDIAEYLLGPDKEENIEIFKGWLAQITNAGA